MAIEFRKFFARTPVFTAEDLRSAEPTLTTRAVQDRLQRAIERGEILRIRKDLYAAVPGDVSADQFEPDRFQVMAALKPDAIFCGHSALELLGLAYSLWSECLAFTHQRREPFTVKATRFRPLAPPPGLVEKGLEQLAVTSHDRAGVFVRSLAIERVLVEGFRSPQQFGGLAEFLSSANGILDLKPDLLRQVLDAYGEKRLYAAVGWFLDERVHLSHIDSSLLATMEQHVPKMPVYLDRKMGPTRTSARWNLLVPERILRLEESDAAEF